MRKREGGRQTGRKGRSKRGKEREGTKQENPLHLGLLMERWA